MENNSLPIPKPREKRLPAKAKTLEIKGSILCPDMVTAICVRQYGSRKGWAMVQRSEKRGVRVWRLS